MLTVARNGK